MPNAARYARTILSTFVCCRCARLCVLCVFHASRRPVACMSTLPVRVHGQVAAMSGNEQECTRRPVSNMRVTPPNTVHTRPATCRIRQSVFAVSGCAGDACVSDPSRTWPHTRTCFSRDGRGQQHRIARNSTRLRLPLAATQRECGSDGPGKAMGSSGCLRGVCMRTGAYVRARLTECAECGEIRAHHLVHVCVLPLRSFVRVVRVSCVS